MKLFKHQQKLLDENPAKHLLAWGTGSGKTRTAIELADKKLDPTLVICPKSLTENWVNEIHKWSKLAIPECHYLVYSKEHFKKAMKVAPDHLGVYKTIIIDEAHYFSNYKSQLTKALYECIKIHNPRNIYLLTATPFLSTPFNLYSLAKILGHNWDWYKFKKFFFHDIKMGRRTIPVMKKNMEGEIAKLVSKLGSTVRLEDCMDVPEQTFECEYFELTKEQKKVIDGLNDVLSIVRAGKIWQLEGGFLHTDNYSPNVEVKTEKIDRLLDYVENNKKIAIVCKFTLEIDSIVKLLKEKYPGKNIYKLTGHSTGHERQHIIDEIKKNDDAVIVIQAQLCEGYSLDSIPIMVFYSMDYSLKNYIQIIGRLQRADNIKKNVYVFFITKDSVGANVYNCVVNLKMDFQIEIYAKKGDVVRD